ncbi:hypothetical protein POSPLADRAFT_1062988 [Postia placenta MAD-698-R-SB12]|uniref:Uncharacterized protein n=1 Tax=Postia placenta MAD-698-R-SB12 TaxID=670580 RepID=A0A1X6MIE7_9APHY|nr:hypothetical protein POSPLADRAFT_1062988 [Postia placenta MAD-698-R-SB12]OSX56089.1 hypothetical protein POSPLADRAFT_1062988 [Postia placenta MAD-698-R-SB12]
MGGEGDGEDEETEDDSRGGHACGQGWWLAARASERGLRADVAGRGNGKKEGMSCVRDTCAQSASGRSQCDESSQEQRLRRKNRQVVSKARKRYVAELASGVGGSVYWRRAGRRGAARTLRVFGLD